jgi:predicted metal-binding transcription factor (methanogenesis marker protein 9)
MAGDLSLAEYFKLKKDMAETPKVGRPTLPKKEKRGRFISTRVSPPEYDEIMAAVKSSGMAKTEWVRTKLIAAARRA